MSIASGQWSIAADIPVNDRLACASGIICGDQLYILGGMDTKSVYSCSLSDLFQSCRDQSASKSKASHLRTWRKLANLPIYDSTCTSLCGHLLAIGGTTTSANYSSKETNAVHAYKPTSNSWEVISEMSMARHRCFAITLPTTNELMVVGGRSWFCSIGSVEIASWIILVDDSN